MASFLPPPPTAAWRHRGERSGLEEVSFHPLPDGLRAEGRTEAVEDGHAWTVGYVIDLDRNWTTRRARITTSTRDGTRHTEITADGAGHWLVDGEPAPHLAGCLDVDLEASAMTNAFPVHRMALPVGARAAAPAAYVRVAGPRVERLEQDYTRVPDTIPAGVSHQRYDYHAPVFDFACLLVYDEHGLILDYPEIAVRTAPP